MRILQQKLIEITLTGNQTSSRQCGQRSSSFVQRAAFIFISMEMIHRCVRIGVGWSFQWRKVNWTRGLSKLIVTESSRSIEFWAKSILTSHHPQPNNKNFNDATAANKKSRSKFFSYGTRSNQNKQQISLTSSTHQDSSTSPCDSRGSLS